VNCIKCGSAHDRKSKYCAPCHAAYMRDWRKTHPLTGEARRRANVRSMANVYLRRGHIQRQPCQDCGSDKAQMHHENYACPLAVTWLCRDCRSKRHKRHATKVIGNTFE
jgi:hypothetical protein